MIIFAHNSNRDQLCFHQRSHPNSHLGNHHINHHMNHYLNHQANHRSSHLGSQVSIPRWIHQKYHRGPPPQTCWELCKVSIYIINSSDVAGRRGPRGFQQEKKEKLGLRPPSGRKCESRQILFLTTKRSSDIISDDV